MKLQGPHSTCAVGGNEVRFKEGNVRPSSLDQVPHHRQLTSHLPWSYILMNMQTAHPFLSPSCYFLLLG